MHESSQSDDTPQSLGDLERAASERPDDAKALVALANAYWLAGSGPEAVSDLASRAMAASDPRQRVARWQQVSARFPTDDLARANVADNAAALAGAEHDYDALDLAIATYEQLRETAEQSDQREALDTAIRTLRAWRF